MGNCHPSQSNHSKEVNTVVRQHIQQYQEEYKLLILGAGDAGKSTFMKQCKIGLMGGFSRNETLSAIVALRNNVIKSMQKLIALAQEGGVVFSERMTAHFSVIMESEELSHHVAECVSDIWADEEFKAYYYEVRNISETASSVPYYFDNAIRFATMFKPTDEDILRCKLKTTGINEVEVQHKGRNFRLVDVGGQRAERRKWLHCFDEVTAVLFLVSTDGYNMTLEEDGTTNRMKESLDLLRDISSSTHLNNKKFMLIFNKSDLLKEKIQTVPVSEFFEGISPDADFETSMKFIQDLFLKEFKGNTEPLVVETCALEKEICDTIFNSFHNQQL